MMNKWCWLILITLLWLVAGFIMFDQKPCKLRQGDCPTANADRIVSAAPDVTEILFALGLDKQITGVSQDSNWPDQAKNKPKIGTFWQPDIEAVIAANPTLVITSGFTQQQSLAQRLQRIGYKTLYFNIETIADFFQAVQTIGQVTNKTQVAQQLISNTKNTFAKISALTGGVDKPKVLFVVQRNPLRVAGTEVFVNELIGLAGGKNAIGKTIQKYPPVGAEYVLACNVDVIIEPAMLHENIADQQADALKYWSKYKTLPAVKNNRIYVVDGDELCRLGPRIGMGVETIAKCLRPEIFAK